MRLKISKQVVVCYLSIIILLLVQSVFSDSRNIRDNIVIEAMYLVFPLVGLIYGFISSKYYLKLHLSFSKTRLEIYLEFIKSMVISIVYALSIHIIAIIFNLILYNYNSFSEVFTSKYLILFISSFVLQTSLGFFQGLFKLKTYIFIIILAIINIFNLLIDKLYIDSLIVSIIYFSCAILLIYFDYFIIKRIKIQ